MKILDLDDPTLPSQVGSYDTTGEFPWGEAVRARDSFAYLVPQVWDFRVIDVSLPNSPVLAGFYRIWSIGRAVALRDSLAYVAEDRRFEIFSIANPRAPRLVGSCASAHAGSALWLADTLAYANMSIFNIKDPAHPFVVGEFGEWPYGNCVKDTFAYLAINYGGLQVWSVADPTAPRLIDTVCFPRGYDVLVVDSLLYFGGLDLRVLKLDNPAHPTEIGHYSTPWRVKRLAYSAPYIYAACFDAGVAILEVCHSGVEEQPTSPATIKIRQLRCEPNPVRGQALVTITDADGSGRLRLTDVTGASVPRVTSWREPGERRLKVDVSQLPSGVYFVSLEGGSNPEGSKRTKLVKQ